MSLREALCSFWLVVVRVPVNRMRRVGIGLGLFGVLLMVGLGVHSASAQPDSVRAALLEEKGFPPDHSPRRALWRAAAVPGWGQFYNRQYYKVPFVYAGLAGLGYAIFETNRSYRLHRRAAIFAQGQRLSNGGGDIPEAISNWKDFRAEYEEAVRQAGGTPDESSLPLSPSQLRDERDQFRRWRDLSILGTGLFYALTVLDAYISAHLLSFNVEDVALDVRPSGGERLLAEPRSGSRGKITQISLGRPSGVGLRVHVRF